MLCRETPTASASCCCVQPRSPRSSLTRFRTLGDVKLAFHHNDRAEISECQVYSTLYTCCTLGRYVLDSLIGLPVLFLRFVMRNYLFFQHFMTLGAEHMAH